MMPVTAAQEEPMSQSIPTGPHDLTPDWMTSALRAADLLEEGSSVRDAQLTPVGQGVGVLCQLFRVALTYDGSATADAPATVIAKLPSPERQTRDMAQAFKFYEREVRFYDELAGSLAIPTPRAFMRAFDPETGDFVLLLEDLGGLRMGDQVVGASEADCDLLVRSLAQHHAPWWNDPRLARLTWLPTAGSDLNKSGMTLYPVALPGFLAAFGDQLPPAVVALAERFVGAADGILDRFERRDRTICHGDWRLDNFFFGTGDGQPPLMVIDWQIALQAPGTYDLGYFMSQSVDVHTRRKLERGLIDLYYDLLLEGGVRGYSREQLLDDYRWTLLFCLAYPVMSAGMGDLANERGVALNRAMTERCLAAIEDWDCAALI